MEPGPTPARLKDLENRLGYTFRDRALLVEALTHSSSAEGRSSPNNERLEFLGDRVIGVTVAAMLYGDYPTASEGELALRFNALVRAETCAGVAEKIRIGPALKLGKSAEDDGGRSKPAILSDACEAVIAAVFLDGGQEAAAAAVERLWRPLMEEIDMPRRDAKTELQEWSQKRGLGQPEYALAAREGPDHAPRFEIEVSIAGKGVASGTGPSKRAAEQSAAEAFLRREKVWNDDA